ncbi:cytochrome c oxidase subunit II [Pelomonas sp. KK5]|uniref:cytochrome c oxidase subunit II n=1 Tax=Pelomonas sp. KK5 TaxID=1855730 RepID=UPI00097C53D1|nr:cytochrome c oxidase subunit II [Pelomonas sp. KK5]
MLIAIALIVMVFASLVFHFLSPWQPLALASNWREIDRTLQITFEVTGIFFVVLNLFLIYVLIRWRRRPGKDSAHEPVAYQPTDHKLERWLTLVTAVGIGALLAPGLETYAAYVKPPADAMDVEVVGTQWQWRFRLPGADGKLGHSDARFVTPANPLGVDPDDPAGQDDVIIDGNEIHLPNYRPVKMALRSLDVLHDFYVPPMRARLNMVPGLVTTYWFMPTKEGRYEAMCAQLCGVGHANMRGVMVIEDDAKFAAWLGSKPTLQASLHPAAAPSGDLVANGQSLAKAKGCTACHTVDGSPGVGPTWKGLYGSTQQFADGSSAKVDDAFVAQEIHEPASRIVKGFPPVMPKTEISDDELKALTAYIKAQGN